MISIQPYSILILSYHDSNYVYSDLFRCPFIIGYVPFRRVVERVLIFNHVVQIEELQPWRLSVSFLSYSILILIQIGYVPFPRIPEWVVTFQLCHIDSELRPLRHLVPIHSMLIPTNVDSGPCRFQLENPTSPTWTSGTNGTSFKSLLSRSPQTS